MKRDSRKLRPSFDPRSAAAACATALLFLFYGSTAAEAQRLQDSRLKNGSAVRRAFRQVVEEPRQATVRIRSDGQDAALGVVVDASGFVLTKASQLGESVECRIADGRELPARVVGVHVDYDLAMLKVDAEDLSVITWANGEDPAVGAWLATPGTGRDPVAVGVVSVARRKIERVPGVLGISIAEGENGPTITQVFPNSGAARAGLKVDDVITRVSGRVIESRRALTRALTLFRPGDTLELSILRGEDKKSVRATLGDPVLTFPGRANLQKTLGGRLSRRRGGFQAVLQHDTVLRPEDCGGVVVGLSGRALGVNIARAGRIESYAIPAAVVRRLIVDLKSGRLAPKQAAVPEDPAAPPMPETAEK